MQNYHLFFIVARIGKVNNQRLLADDEKTIFTDIKICKPHMMLFMLQFADFHYL